MLVATYLLCSRKGQRGFHCLLTLATRGSVLELVVTNSARQLQLLALIQKSIKQITEGSVPFLRESTNSTPALLPSGWIQRTDPEPKSVKSPLGSCGSTCRTTNCLYTTIFIREVAPLWALFQINIAFPRQVPGERNVVSPPRKRRGAHTASAAGLLLAAGLGQVKSDGTGDEGKNKGIFLIGSLTACISILKHFKIT